MLECIFGREPDRVIVRISPRVSLFNIVPPELLHPGARLHVELTMMQRPYLVCAN